MAFDFWHHGGAIMFAPEFSTTGAVRRLRPGYMLGLLDSRLLPGPMDPFDLETLLLRSPALDVIGERVREELGKPGWINPARAVERGLVAGLDRIFWERCPDRGAGCARDVIDYVQGVWDGAQVEVEPGLRYSRGDGAQR